MVGVGQGGLAAAAAAAAEVVVFVLHGVNDGLPLPALVDLAKPAT